MRIRTSAKRPFPAAAFPGEVPERRSILAGQPGAGRSGVPALQRGAAVLHALAGPFRHTGATPQELRRHLKTPQATLYRLLKALAEAEWIAQSPDGRFHLGLGLMALGHIARAASPLVQKAQPFLRDVAIATGHMGELVGRAGPETLMILETWQTERTSLRIAARPGLFFPVSDSVAHGLVFLAFDGPRRLDRFLRRARAGHAGRLQGTPEQIETAVLRVRETGYALLRQVPPSTARVSVPVFDPHAREPRLAGALAVVCGAEEVHAARAAEWGAVLKAKARELEARF